MEPKDSLRIINEMIATTKGNIQHNAKYFLLWGWIVIAGCLGHFALWKFTSCKHPYIAWLIVVVGFIVNFIIGYRDSKRNKVITHLEKIYGLVWVSFGISYLILIIFGRQMGHLYPPLIFIMVGSATFLSGAILKFKPLVYGGLFLWAGSIALFYIKGPNGLLISAGLVAIGYLVPGYLLKRKKH